MHTSVKLNTPVEFINVQPLNPLISKCEIKVCYVDDKPNRNGSVITKDTAREMANSLPGSPIVGYYNSETEDFEEHNRIIDISNGKFEIKDTTRPYGFVDLSARVWFQKFLDDGMVEREYLMTEGYLWTGQYPECKRVLAKGNNQSMELDPDYIDAYWSKDKNGEPQFFIINEAIISKLCILGEDVEPCFEGAQITPPKMEFSFDENFKNELFSMMNELKELLKEGGAKMFTRYAVEIGDSLWNALYSHISETYSNEEGSLYRIESVCEENEEKFAVLQNRNDMKYYRLNFASTEEEFTFNAELAEIEYEPSEEPQFSLEAVEEFEKNYAAKGKTEKDDDDENDNNSEDKKCPKCGKPVDECDCDDKDGDDEDDKKKKYNLEEVVEYAELKAQYDELETKYNTLVEENEQNVQKLGELNQFKLSVERKDKEAMIESFYMLSDEDKKDVIDNIDTYSLNDIEAKLSIICVRNKVSFNLDDDNNNNNQSSTTFNLNNTDLDDNVPAWVKSLRAVANEMK